MASKRYRCFFCDEVFTNRRTAWEHFGEQNCESDVPACVDPLRTDEKARMTALREAQEYAMKCQNEAQAAEDKAGDVEALYAELRRYFGEDCNSVWLAGDRYKSALNRISDLEALEKVQECVQP